MKAYNKYQFAIEKKSPYPDYLKGIYVRTCTVHCTNMNNNTLNVIGSDITINK